MQPIGIKRNVAFCPVMILQVCQELVHQLFLARQLIRGRSLFKTVGLVAEAIKERLGKIVQHLFDERILVFAYHPLADAEIVFQTRQFLCLQADAWILMDGKKGRQSFFYLQRFHKFFGEDDQAGVEVLAYLFNDDGVIRQQHQHAGGSGFKGNHVVGAFDFSTQADHRHHIRHLHRVRHPLQGRLFDHEEIIGIVKDRGAIFPYERKKLFCHNIPAVRKQRFFNIRLFDQFSSQKELPAGARPRYFCSIKNKNTRMKKTMITMLVMLATLQAPAQSVMKDILSRLHYGMRAGAQASNFTHAPFSTNGLAGFHAGLLIDYRLSQHLSIEEDFLFSTQGAEVSDHTFTERRDLRLSYLAVPVVLKYRARSGLYVEAGMQTAMLLADASHTGLGDFANSIDAGAVAGLGYQQRLEKGNGWGVGVRYFQGFTDVGRFRSPALRSDFTNSLAQLSVSYIF